MNFRACMMPVIAWFRCRIGSKATCPFQPAGNPLQSQSMTLFSVTKFRWTLMGFRLATRAWVSSGNLHNSTPILDSKLPSLPISATNFMAIYPTGIGSFSMIAGSRCWGMLLHGAWITMLGCTTTCISHPRLDLTRPEDVHSEVARNDSAMRYFLTNSGHASSISRLHNIIALPYGLWPPSKAGVQSILNYLDPEGRPVQAIFEAGSYTEARYLQVSYSKDFDPMRIPRINGSIKGVNFVIQQASNFPAAESCLLGPLDPTRMQDSDTLQDEIQRQIDSLKCLYGVYSVAGKLYETTASGVLEIPVTPHP